MAFPGELVLLHVFEPRYKALIRKCIESGIRFGIPTIVEDGIAEYRPFTVFLNPDGSLHFKYGGTLYGDDFLDVIRRIKCDVARKGSIKAEDAALAEYSPPAKTG